MMMRKRAGRNACRPASITSCTSWQFSGKSSSLLSHPLSIGTAGPASLCPFPSSAFWQLWPGTWPLISAAPSASKTRSPPWCSWPSALLFQVGFWHQLWTADFLLGFLWGLQAAAWGDLCNLCLSLCCQSNSLQGGWALTSCKQKKNTLSVVFSLCYLIVFPSYYVPNTATQTHKWDFIQDYEN